MHLRHQYGTSVIHGLNPLTKIVSALTLMIHAFLLPGAGVPWMLAGILAAVALLAGVLRPLAAALAWMYLPFVFFLFLLHGLFHPPGGTELARIWIFIVQLEPLQQAALTAGRVLVMVSAFTLLFLTTHPGRLMQDLQRRGLHWSICYVITATLLMLPTMRDRATQIFQAQQARGLDATGSLSKRLRALPSLVGPMLYGALLDVEDRAMALEARGVTLPGKRNFLHAVQDSGPERLWRLTCLLSLGAAIGVRIWKSWPLI